MRLGSLFDGSGTAPLAASMCGIDPVWASEIEPYPIAVTKARFPHMLHLGSITEIDGGKVVPVDIICGGSPCQDLSVAGKQAGLHEGTRSHLFFEMTRIITEMRGATNGKYPRYIVWENVPGAFSSNSGRDFLAVLQSFAEIADPDVHVPEPESKSGRLAWKYAGEIVGDGWSIAWRTVDAQYWGVPQRRRRIYLVADLGSERAGEVLFERAGVSGNSEPGGTAREEIAGDAENCAGAAGFKAGNGAKAGGIGYSEEVAPTLAAASSGTNQVPSIVYCLQGNGIDRALTAGCNGKGWRENECYTLNTIDRPAVAYATDVGFLDSQEDVSPTLLARMYKDPHLVTYPTSAIAYIVRRLTPTECARLQGFPDWWGDIDQKDSFTPEEYRFWLEVRNTHAAINGKQVKEYTEAQMLIWYNKLHTDSAEYGMWGNGMALPNMLHVMRGIAREVGA